MVLTEHKQYYDEMFKIPGFLDSEQFMMFGYQEISKDFHKSVSARSFKHYLRRRGVMDITVLDYDDKRADIYHDMNYPCPKIKEKYDVFCDIGCLEHVFNTYQCIKNCMEAVKVGGLYVLVTPISGYVDHGIHTFNSKALKWVIENNGFEIEYSKHSFQNGKPCLKDYSSGNVLLWLVARREEREMNFLMPIQECKNVLHESYLYDD